VTLSPIVALEEQPVELPKQHSSQIRREKTFKQAHHHALSHHLFSNISCISDHILFISIKFTKKEEKFLSFTNKRIEGNTLGQKTFLWPKIQKWNF